MNLSVTVGTERGHVADGVRPTSNGAMGVRRKFVVAAQLTRLALDPRLRFRARSLRAIPPSLVVAGTQTFGLMPILAPFTRAHPLSGVLLASGNVARPATISALGTMTRLCPAVQTKSRGPLPVVAVSAAASAAAVLR